MVKAMGQLHAAARNPGMVRPADIQIQVVGDLVARFVETSFTGKHLAGDDQGLGAGAAVRQAALHEKLVESDFHRRPGLGVSLHHERRGVAQQVRLAAEQIEMLVRLAGQHIGPFPRAVDAKQRDEGCLAGVGVLADLLADCFLVALDVEQIVGNLEQQPGNRARSPSARGAPPPTPAPEWRRIRRQN